MNDRLPKSQRPLAANAAGNPCHPIRVDLFYFSEIGATNFIRAGVRRYAKNGPPPLFFRLPRGPLALPLPPSLGRTLLFGLPSMFSLLFSFSRGRAGRCPPGPCRTPPHKPSGHASRPRAPTADAVGGLAQQPDRGRAALIPRTHEDPFKMDLLNLHRVLERSNASTTLKSIAFAAAMSAAPFSASPFFSLTTPRP